jgi:hypothetical protein
VPRIAIWCVEQKPVGSRGHAVNEGRFAKRDDKILIFDTEAEAQAEVKSLRAKHGFWAGGNWVFFTMPLPTEEAEPCRGQRQSLGRAR